MPENTFDKKVEKVDCELNWSKTQRVAATSQRVFQNPRFHVVVDSFAKLLHQDRLGCNHLSQYQKKGEQKGTDLFSDLFSRK